MNRIQRLSLLLLLAIASSAAAQEFQQTPLSDMTAQQRYRGFDGGLYGGGKNHPPVAHERRARRLTRAILPLNARGFASEQQGKIVLLSIGMSNTTMEFAEFKRMALEDDQVSRKVVLVDGAQGGQDAADWANPQTRVRKERPPAWQVVETRLKGAGVSPQQVQALWIKQALRNPKRFGAFPAPPRALQANLEAIVREAARRFPNLKLAFVSSRIYAGFATSELNPEPHAFESAFAVRWLIEDQIRGKKSLNSDPARGKIQAPLLLWGPYLWADGPRGRKADKLIWRKADFASDGTHPSAAGTKLVARELLVFFKDDPLTRLWFRAR